VKWRRQRLRKRCLRLVDELGRLKYQHPRVRQQVHQAMVSANPDAFSVIKDMCHQMSSSSTAA
jgi:hypothetical protein